MARCDKYFNGSPRTEEYRQFIDGNFELKNKYYGLKCINKLNSLIKKQNVV